MESQKPINSMLGNRYQIQNLLGSGGMAVVYLARDTMLERSVAIKLLRKDFTFDEAFRDRFRQEARAAANLSHPNIVTVYDFGLDVESPYLVLEYLPGTNLKSIIKKKGKFTVRETLSLITQAAEGLGYAHRAGLVHCDVKPQNLLVTPENQLKITDFGIARALSTIQPDEKSEMVWGSPQYFSPEQGSGYAPSPASDVYSLGVIMYEMLTGRLPFISENNDPNELIQLHQEVKPIPPRRFNKEIQPALEQIILKLLAKEPSARYRTADQLARILRNLEHQNNGNGKPANSSGPQPSPAYTPAPSSPQPTAQPQMVQTAVNQEERPLDIDWITIGLGLLTFTAVAGLIPFWLYVWFTLSSNTPLP